MIRIDLISYKVDWQKIRIFTNYNTDQNKIATLEWISKDQVKTIPGMANLSEQAATNEYFLAGIQIQRPNIKDLQSSSNI